jgi:ABC-type multidrug transport system ATPase subunit
MSFLLDRIGIIRSGVLQCVGTSQHLKSRYGSGYRVEVRVPISHQSIAREWLRTHFPGSREVEVTDSRIKLQTDASAIGQSLASIFRSVEGARKELALTDYAVGQTSLEDIFLTLAGQAAQA